MMSKNANEAYVKSAIIFLIFLDICRHIAIFIHNMGPYNDTLIELDFGVFVGLALIGMYGVFTGRRPLVLIHLAFYVGQALSGMTFAVISSYRYSAPFMYASAVYQLMMLIGLATYLRVRLPDKEDASCASSADADAPDALAQKLNAKV